MNISVLVIDHGISEGKSTALQLMKSIKMEYLPISYCNTISEACPKYLQIFHDLILINSSNLDDSLFDLLEKYVDEKSAIIVMSDTAKHAVSCCKYNITDYLITPISKMEFQNTILKAISLIAIAKNKKTVITRSKEKFNKYITVPSLKKIDIIKVADILYFEADGRYTLIHSTNGTSKIASKNIGEFQKLLNEEVFCRIHHKYIINLERLLKINKIDGYSCQMTTDLAIPVSKRKLEQLNRVLNI